MQTSIALIDDETVHAAFYQKALEAYGYAVEHFKSPASFLTRIEKGKISFRLFIADLMMPARGAYPNSATSNGILTGLLLVQDIRRLDPESPILILTNVNIGDVLARVRAVVADKPNLFLVKKSDYPPDELAAAANALLTTQTAFPEKKGLLRRFLNSLILQPNFFGIGMDLKRIADE